MVDDTTAPISVAKAKTRKAKAPTAKAKAPTAKAATTKKTTTKKRRRAATPETAVPEPEAEEMTSLVDEPPAEYDEEKYRAIYARLEAAPVEADADDAALMERNRSIYEALLAENEELQALVEEAESKARLAEERAVRVAGAPAAAAGGAPIAALQADDIVWPSPDDAVPFWEREECVEALATPPTASTPTEPDPNPVHIVHVTAEMAPLAKVGGLADVVTGLSRACSQRGHNVEVVLPFYECIPESAVSNLAHERSYGSYHRGSQVMVDAFVGEISGVRVLLLRPQNNFFKGEKVYGGGYDEREAYIFFCRAALELLRVSERHPDVIHMHEWHTCALALMYWDMYYDMGLNRSKIVLTIHNMDHTGEVKAEELDYSGLDGESYATVEKAVDERTIGHNPERMSLLKAGIVYSSAVTTVSPTYREETLGGGGGWLNKTLSEYSTKYHGVLNAIDTASWDPRSDMVLPTRFGSAAESGKALCQEYVRRGLGLDVPKAGKRVPIVVCVTRLVPQKGVHMIKHAAERCEAMGAQFVLLGSGHLAGEFEGLAAQMKAGGAGRCLLMYNEALAHFLYAAADVVLVPSMFEPCGLTQMVAQRYGAAPLVRRTGGLADTVIDVDSSPGAGTGFVFDGAGEGDIEECLGRAIRMYKDQPAMWEALANRCMAVDNSWARSAEQYVQLYRSA